MVDRPTFSPNDEGKIPYPKSVFLIIANEFCERFSFYGMRAVLSLYLRNYLELAEGDAKVVYHIYLALSYSFPLLGAIISDSWLGKFKTIFYLSIIYACGNMFLSLASAKPIGLPQKGFSYFGLFLIAFGTGGIKPCVSSFGGDQFILPQQEKQLAAFFSMFYFSVNAGSFLSTLVSPIMREKVKCFGDPNCFPLAFGVPGVLMVIAIRYRLYIHNPPAGNLVVIVSNCVGYGLRQKCKSKDKVDHWLDRAEPKYGKELVTDVKAVLKVLLVVSPLPIFWALFEQQGSGWTFQASRMCGDLGNDVTVLPDQMQISNPLLVLIFIPLFTYGIYPLFAKCHILKKQLSRMVCGGILTAGALAISACVSFAVESTYPVLPTSGNSQVRIYNTLNCKIIINARPYIKNIAVRPMNFEKVNVDKIKGRVSINYTMEGCENIGNDTREGKVIIIEKKTILFYLNKQHFKWLEDDIQKAPTAYPKIRTLVDDRSRNFALTYKGESDLKMKIFSEDTSMHTIYPGAYKLNGFNKKLKLETGGVYTVIVAVNNKTSVKNLRLLTTTSPNSVHIFWQIPQYVVITVGEVMFTISGLSFSYSQAPLSMKAFVASCWHMTNALGNVLIVIIEAAKLFEKQSYNFLLYSGLMIVDMIGFFFLTLRFKYSDEPIAPKPAESE